MVKDIQWVDIDGRGVWQASPMVKLVVKFDDSRFGGGYAMLETRMIGSVGARKGSSWAVVFM